MRRGGPILRFVPERGRVRRCIFNNILGSFRKKNAFLHISSCARLRETAPRAHSGRVELGRTRRAGGRLLGRPCRARASGT